MTMTTKSMTPSPTKQRRISPWWGLLLVPVVFIGLTATGVLKPPASSADQAALQLETAAVTQGAFRIGVSGTGTLKAVSTFDIKPSLSGTVQSLPSEGDRVQKGQLVARLDDTTFARAVENNQLALNKALAQLEGTKANQANNRGTQQQAIASAQASFENAQTEVNSTTTTLSNQRKLYAVGGVSAQEVRNAEAALSKATATLESARVALQIAKSTVNLKANSDTQDLRNLQLAVDQAKVQLRNAQTDLSKTKIYAPVSGIVSSVPGQVGGPASSQAALFTVINDNTIELPVQVDETEIGKVKLGQKAEVKLDAINNKTFTGRVTRVSPKAEVVQNIAVFYVTVSLPNQNRALRPGMTGEAEIISRELLDVVQIPKRALQTENGRTSVQVIDPETKKPVVKTVQIGPDDGATVVIKGGLESGEKVVLPARTAAPRQGVLP
jgi:HlyD family secretion protein